MKISTKSGQRVLLRVMCFATERSVLFDYNHLLTDDVMQATFKGWIDIMKHATDIKDVRRQLHFLIHEMSLHHRMYCFVAH